MPQRKLSNPNLSGGSSSESTATSKRKSIDSTHLQINSSSPTHMLSASIPSVLLSPSSNRENLLTRQDSGEIKRNNFFDPIEVGSSKGIKIMVYIFKS